ncbi:GAF domain-containing protein [Persicobacter diffluens]|uniref:PAS domain-containing protein n=1 Tax=Persicobacter diffluens TaxID=981 RepID=A0AAN4VX95_9BACT|nr:hypothetical protein PEDI_23360 [Persicobacter diffluens]
METIMEKGPLESKGGKSLQSFLVMALGVAILLLVSLVVNLIFGKGILLSVILGVVLVVGLSVILWKVKEGFVRLHADLRDFTRKAEDWKNSEYATWEFSYVHRQLFKVSNYLDEQVAHAEALGRLDFQTREVEQEDKLGLALQKMGRQLQEASQEERKKQWVSKGLADFSALFRRTDSKNIHAFCEQLVSELSKYVNANQVAMYVVEENEEAQVRLTMKGCYAFNRKKFIDHQVSPGEGLVGQAYLEKMPIYLKEVPQDYYRITSGLGQALPKNVYILPLMYNEQVRGVLEIAAFDIFEAHELEFINKLGEDVAAMIDSQQVGERTQQLLSESLKQKQELEASEEELRQNMEEMQATQEEMERLKREEAATQKAMMKRLSKQNDMMEKILDEVEGKVYLKDHEGKFHLYNQAVVNDYGVKRDELKGKDDYHFFDYEVAKGYWDAELEIIKNKLPVRTIERVEVNGNVKYWLIAKRPMSIPSIGTTGLLGIQREITDIVKTSPGYIALLQEQYPDLKVLVDVEKEFAATS